jgi:DNA-binding HxlR family transcriptional regulator
MALARRYDAAECRLAGALEIVGERWTLLIIREALRGAGRFSDLTETLGVASNVLQRRLEFLIDMEILERRQYQDRPIRHEYVLTAKGRDLWPVLAALIDWSETHLEWSGPPRLGLQHDGCGGPIRTTHRCRACDTELSAPHIEIADHLRAGRDSALSGRS